MDAILHQSSRPATMSSIEIAELTKKRHDHVMRDVRAMIVDLHGEEGIPKFGDTQKNPQNGQEYAIFVLPKRETLVLVSGYSTAMRAAIIDRWIELEAAPAAFQVPTSLSSALRLAAEQAETIEQQAVQLAEAKPAVAFVAQYVDSTGLKGFRQVCKLLKAIEPDFRDFLIKEKIMYRLGSEWVPHAAHLAAGRMQVKAGKSDVSGHAFNSARFTAKGVSWVAGEWAKYQLEQSAEVHS